MAVTLDEQQLSARSVLIRVADGTLSSERVGRISYKDLWTRISKEKWGRGTTRKVVGIITTISAFEIDKGRPPLNELVVSKGKLEPTEPWNSIKMYLMQEFGAAAPYASHEEAQNACWNYWRKKAATHPSETEAEEGYLRDRSSKFRTRNAQLIAECKERDRHTCQACEFRLEIDGSFVIDCHHKNPLSSDMNVRITKLDELVCLCPTCHRIAHTSKVPLDIAEIRAARAAGREPLAREFE